MTLTDRIKGIFSLEKRNVVPLPQLSAAGLSNWLDGGLRTNAGERISEHTALQLTTVYSCVSLISSQVASLPIRLWERNGKSKVEVTGTPLANLLSIAPSPDSSAYSFWEAYTGSLCINGNAFAQITRDGDGEPTGLWLLDPRQTRPVRLPNGALAYRTGDGQQGNSYRLLDARDVLHTPLFSLNGIEGLSPIAQARETLGAARAAEAFGARWFGNGASPSGILTIDPDDAMDLDERTMAAAKASRDASVGGNNRSRVIVLPGSWKWQAVSVPAEEAQFLETQKWGMQQIASLYHVPLSMLGSTEHLSDNNASQQLITFVTMCLRSYLSRIENEISRKLLIQADGSSQYSAQFDITELMRGDPQQLMQTIALGRQWSVLSMNDAREMLGLNPVAPEQGGDVVIAPLNYQNAASFVKPDPTSDDDTPDLGQFRSAFLSVFRDGVGRLASRDAEKRTAESARTIFSPILQSLAQTAGDNAKRSAGTPEWTFEHGKATAEYLSKLAGRAQKWDTGDLDAIAATEMTKAARTLSLAAHRAAAETTALKGLNSEKD